MTRTSTFAPPIALAHARRRLLNPSTVLVSIALAIAGCAAPTGEDLQGASSEEGEVEAPDAVNAVWRASSALASSSYAWGFAKVDPSSPSLSSAFAFNSAGRVNSYSGSAGVYTVTMPDLGVSGGTVQVVAAGASSTRCKVASWRPSGSALLIDVRCHSPSGVPSASPFVVFFNKGFTDTTYYVQRGAHVYYSGTSVVASHSWNSTGGINTVTSAATGTYTATLAGLAFSNASVHVTAVGADAKYCKIGGWSVVGANAVVRVRCFDTAGNLAPSDFTLSYSYGTPRSYMVGGHAWVSGPTSAPASYSASQHAFACGTTAPITVSGYDFVRYPDTSVAGVPTMALATAYGSDANYCKLASWSPTGTGFGVVMRCFTPAGVWNTSTSFTSSLMAGTYPSPC